MKINQAAEIFIYKIKNIIKYLHLNNLIKNFLNYFGLRVVFKKHNLNSSERLVNSLQYHNIDTVLDIGANKGQFAQDLLNADYKGNIISFEPLSNA